ncbi:MAG: hypothetical protein ACRDRL_05320 [Sciscionella sp.]
MNADLHDFNASHVRRRDSRLAEQTPKLELMVQAAVKAEMLTGDPGWDTFTSYLQAAREHLSRQAISLLDRLRDPLFVNPDMVQATKGALNAVDAQVKLLDAIIAIPADIKKQGTEARDQLLRLAGKPEEQPD